MDEKIIKSEIKLKDTKLTTLNIKIPMFLKYRLLMLCKKTGLKQTEIVKQLIENCEIKGENNND